MTSVKHSEQAAPERTIRRWAHAYAKAVAVRSGPMPILTYGFMLLQPSGGQDRQNLRSADTTQAFDLSAFLVELVSFVFFVAFLSILGIVIALIVSLPMAQLLATVRYVRSTARRLETSFKVATVLVGSWPPLLLLDVDGLGAFGEAFKDHYFWFLALVAVNLWIAHRCIVLNRKLVPEPFQAFEYGTRGAV